MSSKPTAVPRWADGGTTVEPLDAKKTVGHLPGERLPAQWENWFKNSVYNWLKWIDELEQRGEVGVDWKLEDEFMSFDPGDASNNTWSVLEEGGGTAGILGGKAEPIGGVIELEVDNADSATVYTNQQAGYTETDIPQGFSFYAVVAIDDEGIDDVTAEVGWGRGFAGTPTMPVATVAFRYESSGGADTFKIVFLDDASAEQEIDTGFTPTEFTYYHLWLWVVSPTEIRWRIGLKADWDDDNDTFGTEDSLPGSGTIKEVSDVYAYFAAKREVASGPSHLYVDKVRFFQRQRSAFIPA